MLKLFVERKYLHILVRDDHVCSICESIEAYSVTHGGLTFPFELNGREYTLEHMHKGLAAWENSIGGGIGGSIRSHMFHENCRCMLIPVDGMPEYYDELDELVYTQGALGHAGRDGFREELGNELIDTINDNVIHSTTPSFLVTTSAKERRARKLQETVTKAADDGITKPVSPEFLRTETARERRARQLIGRI